MIAAGRVTDGPGLRKLAGILGESDGLGSDDPRVVVGIGVNVDWAAADFPAELAASMTSLRQLTGRAIEVEALLTAFMERLEAGSTPCGAAPSTRAAGPGAR